MKRKKTLSLCLISITALLCASVFCDAQQLANGLFYRNNWQLINPAAIDPSFYFTNKYNELLAKGGYRQQWIGVDGSPQTYYASVEWCKEKHKNDPKTKLGAAVISDRAGAFQTHSLLVNYSYFFNFGRGGKSVLHLGLSGRVNQYHIDTDLLRSRDPNDPLLQGSVINSNFIYTDFSMGAMYRYQQNFYLGFSVPNTIKVGFQNTESGLSRTREIRRHYYIISGGFIPFGEVDASTNGVISGREWVLEPSIWVRAVPAVFNQTLVQDLPLSFDANLRIHYWYQLWAGVGYGSTQMLQTELGYKFKMDGGVTLGLGAGYSFPTGTKYLSLGRSFDLTLSFYGL